MLICLLIWAGWLSGALQVRAQAGNAASALGFDLSNAIVPADQILSGGVGRDGIPSIDQPRFVSTDRARFLKKHDAVLSVTIGKVTRAYPLKILVYHEIVNDWIGTEPVAITYCPLCGTAMVFSRLADGKRLTFGVSGLLYQSDLLMYDRETQSLWSQLKMQAVAGPLVGRPLQLLPSEQMNWGEWRLKYPQAQVLAKPNAAGDYDTNPYGNYESNPRTMFPVPTYRTDLATKAWVIGVILNGQVKAYPIQSLPATKEVEDTLGDVAIKVSYDPVSRQPKVVRAADDQPVPYIFAYWFAWQAFYPTTDLWQP